MAAPDDPYRTGQQLYRRPCPMLAAFTVAPTADASNLVARGNRHRVPAAAPDPHAGHNGGDVDLWVPRSQRHLRGRNTALAAVADVDLMQARRHAAVLAGHSLPADLHLLRKHTVDGTRGLAAVEEIWAERHTHRVAPQR